MSDTPETEPTPKLSYAARMAAAGLKPAANPLDTFQPEGDGSPSFAAPTDQCFAITRNAERCPSKIKEDNLCSGHLAQRTKRLKQIAGK